MIELEKMQRAKMYLDKLANGVDPITNREVPQDSVLNNVRLSRCFFYVSDILRQIIEDGGPKPPKPPKRPKKADFFLSPQDRGRVALFGEPMPVSSFVAQINEAIDQETMKKLPIRAVTDWMVDKGFLAEETPYPGAGKRRRPTPEGEAIGLSAQSRQGQSGEYLVVLYDADAQRFILDNLDEIIQAHRDRAARP